jgi:hypothetical protein
VSGFLLAMMLAACGSSGSSSPASGASVACAQSLTDYCNQPTSSCVKQLPISMSAVTTMSSFCSQCGAPCKGRVFSFNYCADQSIGVATQLGMASQSKGVEILEYFYDPNFNLTAVVDTTSGGTYKASVTCLGGQQTYSIPTCAPYALPLMCP